MYIMYIYLFIQKTSGRLRILAQGRQLEITRSSVADTGRYTCTATNPAGQASLRFQISVIGQSLILVFFSSKNIFF